MGDSFNKGVADDKIFHHKGKHRYQSMDNKTGSKKYYSEQYSYMNNNIKKYDYSGSSKICGIINLGNNCYLNSGLQILASCQELVSELNKPYNSQGIIFYMKDAIYTLLTKELYDPKFFMEYFCNKNSDFIRGSQCCSQNFIRTLIRNMNSDSLMQSDSVNQNYNYKPSGKEKYEYEKFISSNRIFPESKIQSIFSGITKSFSKGRCKKCNQTNDNYSFSYFIDQNLYLDEIDYKSNNFSDVLYSNIGGANNLSMECPNCGFELNLKEYTKFIKLPDVLIFTLERYQGITNNVEIKPNSTISLRNYIDNNLSVDCTEYELFAINIRYGSSAYFGHEICQVKRDGVWYEINDREGHKINYPLNNDCSYGLFYRKIKNNSNNFYSYKINHGINMEEGDDDYYVYENKINEETKKFGDKKVNNVSCCFDGISNAFIIDKKNQKFVQITNYNHTYINAGLEIICLFEEFIKELKEGKTVYGKNVFLIDLIEDAVIKILNNKKVDAYELSQFDFKKPVKSSQDFIINVINTINEEFIKYKKRRNNINLIYTPKKENEIKQFDETLRNLKNESKAKSFFSFIFETHLEVNCSKCNTKIDNYSFIYDIECKINFYNKFKSFTIIELLEENICENYKNCLTRACRHCKIDVGLKIIKLPEIFIFTLIRDKEIRNMPSLKLNDTIDIKKYIDSSSKETNTKYELFAINIKNQDKDDCIIKNKGKWYEISDNGYYKEIPFSICNNSICGLYYRQHKKGY